MSIHTLRQLRVSQIKLHVYLLHSAVPIPVSVRMYKQGWQWVPETRWVFAPLGYGFGSTFRSVGLLMGTKSYPLGLWARICSYNTRTREPMGFLNPIQHRAIVILFCEIITNLTSLSYNSYFTLLFIYAYDGFVTFYDVTII